MKPYVLFQQYIWLVNIIHRYRKLSFEEINRHWLTTELSEGIPMARSSFNRLVLSLIVIIKMDIVIIYSMRKCWLKILFRIGCFPPYQ